MLRVEQKEENEGVLPEGMEELAFSITDDDGAGEEERGSAPLIEACRKNTTEVGVCCSCGSKVEPFILRGCYQQMVALLLIAGAGVTPCDRSRQTALNECPPELWEKVLRWMSRSNTPLQVELLPAAWQGDRNSV